MKSTGHCDSAQPQQGAIISKYFGSKKIISKIYFCPTLGSRIMEAEGSSYEHADVADRRERFRRTLNIVVSCNINGLNRQTSSAPNNRSCGDAGIDRPTT